MVTKRPRASRGRPVIHQEHWRKVSVVLFDRQVSRLDRAVAAMRDRAGSPWNRAALIRALIDGVLDSGFDLARASSEAELRQQLHQQIRKR